MAAHAILGASSADRWMPCPGSVGLAATLPEKYDSGSVYSRQGTAAHALGAHCLKTENWDAWAFIGFAIDSDTEVLWNPLDIEFPTPDEDRVFLVDDDMASAVQIYLDAVAAERERLGPTCEMRVEQSVRPFDDRDDMWGTSDCILIEAFGELVVFDYKHGKGHAVDSEYNVQAMYYAFGAMRELGCSSHVSKVTVVIVQPRAPHAEGRVRSWSLTSAELATFGATLRAAAEATTEPDAPLVPGDHCRWCPAKGVCPALRERVSKELEVHFDAPFEMEPAHPTLPDPRNPAQVARALRLAPMIEEWIKAVEGYAFHLLQAGEDVPGFKLVQRGTHRQWKDPKAAARAAREALKAAGQAEGQIYTEPKMRSPAQLEKMKALGTAFTDEHAFKPEGGFTVAPSDDKRPKKQRHVPEFGDLPDVPQLGPGPGETIAADDWDP